MFSLSTKRKLRRWFYSRSVLILLLILIVLISTPVIDMYRNYSESRELLYDSKERMETLVEQGERLERDIEYLESDLGKEAELRKRFGTGREGELMAVVMDFEYKKKIDLETPEEGFWQDIKERIKGIFGFTSR